jgi:hypothetical protein
MKRKIKKHSKYLKERLDKEFKKKNTKDQLIKIGKMLGYKIKTQDFE